MSTSTTIRLATPSDAETITKFNIGIASETEALRLDPEVVLAGVRTIIAEPGRGQYFVAEREAEIVGQIMVTYEWSDWRNGNMWWIQSVYVAPQARRLGIYRKLQQFVENQARNTPGVVTLRLYVHKENTRAQETYASLGMQRTDYLIYEKDWS